MDRPTLEFLRDTFAAANPGRRIVKCDAEPDHVYFVEQPDGKLTRETAFDSPHDHRAADLDTLVRDLTHRIAAGDAQEVWYSRDRVTGLHSGRPEGDRIVYHLSPSPQLAALVAWEKAGRASVSQYELVTLLRTTFADCFPSAPGLLAAVRELKVAKAAAVDTAVQHGKVSLGKSITAEMSGLSAIPQEVTFRVPVFAEAGALVRADVRVALDPDPVQERFVLIVLPGQVEAAQFAGETWLAATLSGLLADHGGESVPIYRGTP